MGDGRDDLTGVGLDRWGASFPSTHWSVVFGEGEDAGEATAKMLERLCHRYWYPLYAYLRKRGHGSHDAQDLVQGFFAKMLAGDGLAKVDAGRGKFRSYLLGALNHHVSDERKRAGAAKRGGGEVPVSIELELAEKRFKNEPADALTPELLFDREWAMALLSDVVERLRVEYDREGKGEVFEVLSEHLTVKPDKGTYPVLAERLGTSHGNVRVMVTRMRKRYQVLLREVIGETVDSAEDIEGELQALFAAFSAV